MSKIPVVYWSGTGNTQKMAEAIAEGIGNEAMLISVDRVNLDDVTQSSKIALGCSSMGSEVLEEYEFEPFFESLLPFLTGKKVVLFGSYGWGGSYMLDWEQRVIDAGGILVKPGFLALGEPDNDAISECNALGKYLLEA